MSWARGLETCVVLAVTTGLLYLLRHMPTGESISRTSTYFTDRDGDANVPPVSLRGKALSGQQEERRSYPTEARRGGLVLIKSFKTGSTTLATYIAQVGHQRESYFLHPRKGGWFARGELESRRDEGQTFDISLRHVTPYTPYNVLEELVPEASFVTIMRRPVDRFLSLFNFRDELKKKFKTPNGLVAAIRAGKLSQGDARPFCNQLAWLLSGEDADFTDFVDEADAPRIAERIIEEAEKRGVMVLITERMSESFAVLAHHMQWDMNEFNLVAESQRVSKRGRRYVTCPGNLDDPNNECYSAVRGCNQIDELLYDYYARKFEKLVRSLPPSKSQRAKAMLDALPQAKRSMSRFDRGNYPINCVVDGRRKASSEKGARWERDDGRSVNEQLFRHLHSCEGRPR